MFTFRNVNTAFSGLVKYFSESGMANVVSQDSRNGRVFKIDHPVLVAYLCPNERVLFSSGRDCNPFFHIAEALWMLTGRDDLATLQKYVSDFSKFSDDGQTLWGAYGHRWRSWFGMDQISLIIGELRNNPTSRRCVLQMWDARGDIEKASTGGKDVPCLSSKTKFRSPEGEKSIKWLAKQFQSKKNFKWPVYTVDTSTGNQKLSWMTNAWKSGVKRLYRIHFDDGSFVEATANHIFFKKVRHYEGAVCTGTTILETSVCELEVGDRLLAVQSKDASSLYDWKGYKQFKRNIYKNTSGKNMVKEHREYISMFEDLLPEYSIHHKNSVKSDNRLCNLEQIPNSVHFSMDKFGENNPHNKMSKKDKKRRGQKHSKSLTAHWAGMDEETRKAYGTRRENRSKRQWELIENYRSSKSNHKIVKIEKLGFQEVYDFTVPGRHNAVLDNGVLTHNCNTQAYFAINDGRLDMTVCNRSNDMVWGMLGANYVHFSILQEYMADLIGVGLGRYYQFTNNLHVYEWNWEPNKWLPPSDMWNREIDYNYTIPKTDIQIKPYGKGICGGYNETDFYAQATNVLENTSEAEVSIPFLVEVAKPMLLAHACHTIRDYEAARFWMSQVKSVDWWYAGLNWISKREHWYEKRQKEKAQG